jgi:UDP-glucose 4-epimerase
VFNLIPLAFKAIESGEPPRIFGADYPTRDGTCVRDYVHVGDIADAHVAALKDLAGGRAEPGSFRVYNVGRGEGASVREVLDMVADVTGAAFEPEIAERRPGDPARYVANVDRIKADLGWSAKYDLREMVTSAWQAWQHRKTS